MVLYGGSWYPTMTFNVPPQAAPSSCASLQTLPPSVPESTSTLTSQEVVLLITAGKASKPTGFDVVTVPVVVAPVSVTVTLTLHSSGAVGSAASVMREGTVRTLASSVSITPLPLMSILVAVEPLPPRAPALPKLTNASTRIGVPAGGSTEVLKVAS